MRPVALVVEVLDPDAVAGFWAALLGWERRGTTVVDPSGVTGLDLRLEATTTAKTAQNHAHLDLTSDSLEHQRATVARVLALGGRHADVGQGPDEPHVVLADPEGDELCVIEPGNAFLAGCGPVGAVACDGSERVGRFWSRAWGWPLVWDQDGETAVRSPRGGPKITWGGHPPRPGPHRVRLALAAPAGALADEVARLVALGAQVVEDGPGRVLLRDPDGCRFEVAAG